MPAKRKGEPKEKKEKKAKKGGGKTCPIGRDEFRSHAKPLNITIEGKDYEAGVKFNKPGSFGWSKTGVKQTIVVDGKELQVQVTINLTVANSKHALPLPDSAKPADEDDGGDDGGHGGDGGEDDD